MSKVLSRVSLGELMYAIHALPVSSLRELGQECFDIAAKKEQRQVMMEVVNDQRHNPNAFEKSGPVSRAERNADPGWDDLKKAGMISLQPGGGS
jgi:hypothetical protein